METWRELTGWEARERLLCGTRALWGERLQLTLDGADEYWGNLLIGQGGIWHGNSVFFSVPITRLLP